MSTGGGGTGRVEALGALAVTGPLPERTVVVRTEAVAHAWRRELVEAGQAALLVGTGFVTPLGAATAVLERAGRVFTPGEEALRPARIGALLAGPLPLAAFDLDVLRERPGWDAALASTLRDLEAAGLTPADLRASVDPRGRDLALLLERLDAAAGPSWTAARLLREATAALRAEPSLWPYGTPCLAEVTGHEAVALARFLAAIPAITLVPVGARPAREAHAARTTHLFGALPVPTVTTARPTTERDLLAAYLFAPPDELTAPARPRSQAPDGTVQLEEHAGVEDELEATITWVIDEITARGAHLDDLAILVPHLDPYAGLLAERLDELLPDGVHVIGGLPAASTGAGARFTTVLRALAAHLPARLLVDVVPVLRLADDAVDLGRKRAIELLESLGTRGGSPAHPAAAGTWLPALHARLPVLTRALAALTAAHGDERARERLARTLQHVEAVIPAITALDAAAAAIHGDAPLAALWPLVEAALGHVRAGAEGPRVLASLGAALAPQRAATDLRGHAALIAVLDTLHRLRVPVGRFGEPRVTIATLRAAAGLRFTSVRVLGLAEGAVPSSPRQDAVLPDAARATLGVGVPRTEHTVTEQLHALHRAVTAATARVVLSFARMDVDGRYREPSGVLIEAATAVGRAVPGASPAAIPDGTAMRTAWFEPARADLAEVRERWPVRERTRLDRAALTRRVPAAWSDDPLRALDRISPPPADGPTPMDGWFPATGAFVMLPGLTAERPISASALGQLLGCPHRFLYERVLGWRAPDELSDEGGLDALTYGSLFHALAEAFFRDHGAAFCAHQKPLAHWQELGHGFAADHFTAFLEGYPLAGADVQVAQLARLQRDLRALLAADWQDRKEFVDVERAFTTELALASGPVFVHGSIDRLDVVDKATLVRDYKTGRAKPRHGDALMPAYDVQLGLYGLVTQASAKAWGVPKKVQGAYVYPSDGSGEDRAFLDDFKDLAAHTEGWVSTGMRLLQQRQFPRSPSGDDCTFCAFQPVCGAQRTHRARDLLVDTRGALAAFAELKGLGAGQDDDA